MTTQPDNTDETKLECRFCSSPDLKTFVDLGMSPLCESFVLKKNINHAESFYPLHTRICSSCCLVQLDEYVSPSNIFNDYAYFSSFSDSWVKHAKDYTNKVIKLFNLSSNNFIVEIASNDGYLLQHFVEKGFSVLGIEPAENVAEHAIKKGIPTLSKFFGETTAREIISDYSHADLIVANNVLAHVPDLNDFLLGVKSLLSKNGIVTMEFPHLHSLMDGNQFDTIYHEHFSYFSFLTINAIFKFHQLKIFDVEQLKSHGGSLRIYADHMQNTTHPTADNVNDLLDFEKKHGYDNLEKYSIFQEQVKSTKHSIIEFLIEQRRNGKSIVGYGAPGKANTLLNYCGIRTDLLDYVVDKNPFKHGRFTPGTHIPIFSPDKIKETKPDLIVIMPWNLKSEIIKQHSYIRDWGAKFAVLIPTVSIF